MHTVWSVMMTRLFESLKIYFQMEGFSVLTASDGAAAFGTA